MAGRMDGCMDGGVARLSNTTKLDTGRCASSLETFAGPYCGSTAARISIGGLGRNHQPSMSQYAWSIGVCSSCAQAAMQRWGWGRPRNHAKRCRHWLVAHGNSDGLGDGDRDSVGNEFANEAARIEAQAGRDAGLSRRRPMRERAWETGGG